jgi:hypothetical protein
MLIIDSSAAMARVLDQPIDPCLKRLLVLRRDQLLGDETDDLGNVACFVCVLPGDDVEAVETAAGFPIMIDGDPTFEWCLDHAGWLEAPIILSDDGYSVVLLVMDDPTTDPSLLSLLREYACRADGATLT